MKPIRGNQVLVLTLGAVLVISAICVISSEVSTYPTLQEEGHPREAIAMWLSDASVIMLESPANNSVLRSGIVIDIAIEGSFSLSHVLFAWDFGINESIFEPYEIQLPTGDGQHILHLYANDTDNNWESALFSFVTDDTKPAVNSPEDITYIVGSSGHSILWVPTDANPDCYLVLLEKSLLTCGFYSYDNDVNIIVDGHEPGVYNYSIIVTDAACNQIKDQVVVTVLEEPTPTTTTTTSTTTTSTSIIPTVISPLVEGSLPIALGISGIIIALNIIVMRRRP
ncbi:MAG: hypothetical protein ACFFAZ_00465 [Promethearchaeota archaeon]